MTHRSPLVTLVGLVVAFATMFGVNLAVSSASAGAGPGPGAAASSAAETEVGGARFPAEAVYAWRTEDGGLAVAVAVRGDQAAAYLCDGESVEAWLRGRVDGDRIELQDRSGVAGLDARLRDGRLEGEVDLDGEDLAFILDVAEKPAGLYRARGAKTTIGWILLPDGSQVGVQNTGEESVPAPELDPAAPEVTVDGETLTGEPVTGDQDI